MQVTGFPPEAGPPPAESLKLVTCDLKPEKDSESSSS